jgi:tight adherence protein C
MPFIVDLLALSTEAGLDFGAAIGKVVEKARPSPLIEELSQVLKEIAVGSSRSEALREMSVRVNLTEVNSFIAILISADSMGASIGKILRQQSEQIRINRLVRAEKAGAKAATAVIMPMVVTVLPAVALLALGPYIVQFFTGSIGIQ